jgi:hypothetical protein
MRAVTANPDSDEESEVCSAYKKDSGRNSYVWEVATSFKNEEKELGASLNQPEQESWSVSRRSTSRLLTNHRTAMHNFLQIFRVLCSDRRQCVLQPDLDNNVAGWSHVIHVLNLPVAVSVSVVYYAN